MPGNMRYINRGTYTCINGALYSTVVMYSSTVSCGVHLSHFKTNPKTYEVLQTANHHTRRVKMDEWM